MTDLTRVLEESRAGRSGAAEELAALLYDDPLAWRPIAIANRLDDPRAIAVGQQLRVPSLPFVDPETREVVG